MCWEVNNFKRKKALAKKLLRKTPEANKGNLVRKEGRLVQQQEPEAAGKADDVDFPSSPPQQRGIPCRPANSSTLT